MKSDEEDGSPVRAAASILASAYQVPEEASQTSGLSVVTKRMRASACDDTITHQQRWDNMFERLKAYKAKHGDCLVPNRYAEDPQLGSWVSAQRRQYKIVTSGGNESAAMTPDRAKKLTDIGFEWSTTNPRNVPWDTRYDELKDFVRNYGHAEVPMRWEENPQLSNWVSKQRHQYKLMQSGRPTRLSPKRIRMLNDIGFVWEASRRRLKDGASDDGSSSANSVTGPPKPKKVETLNGRKKVDKLTRSDGTNDNLQNMAPLAHVLPDLGADSRPSRIGMDPPAALGANLALQNSGQTSVEGLEGGGDYTFAQTGAMAGAPFQTNMEFWAAAQQRAALAAAAAGAFNPAMFLPRGVNNMLPFAGGVPMNAMGLAGQPTMLPQGLEHLQQQGGFGPMTGQPDALSADGMCADGWPILSVDPSGEAQDSRDYED